MQAKQDGGRRFECTAKTGHFEKSLHLTHTLAARCPNAKFVHKNSLCFTETIIFQLLCCLYLYYSGMLGPVCIRKQRLYTVRRRGSTIHSAAGIPSSGACGNEPFRRYTAVRHVGKFAQSVYRLLASKGLTLWTPGAGIPVLRKLQNGAKPRYTGSVQISLHRQNPVYRVCVNL